MFYVYCTVAITLPVQYRYIQIPTSLQYSTGSWNVQYCTFLHLAQYSTTVSTFRIWANTGTVLYIQYISQYDCTVVQIFQQTPVLYCTCTVQHCTHTLYSISVVLCSVRSCPPQYRCVFPCSIVYEVVLLCRPSVSYPTREDKGRQGTTRDDKLYFIRHSKCLPMHEKVWFGSNRFEPDRNGCSATSSYQVVRTKTFCYQVWHVRTGTYYCKIFCVLVQYSTVLKFANLSNVQVQYKDLQGYVKYCTTMENSSIALELLYIAVQ
jgi:hypothetical protein